MIMNEMVELLTNFCEGQNAYLPERLIDVFGDGNKRSQYGFAKGHPACSCVGRCPLFCPYLYDCSYEFDGLLLLNSEFVFTRQGSGSG